MSLSTKWFLGFLAFVALFAVWAVPAFALKGRMETGCTEHLLEASRTISIDTAAIEIDAATKYLEQNHMTSGFTTIFGENPKEDLGAWYQRLRGLSTMLHAASKTDSKAEQNSTLIVAHNALIKSNGYLNVPDGINAFPHNTILALLLFVSFLGMLFCGLNCLLSPTKYNP